MLNICLKLLSVYKNMLYNTSKLFNQTGVQQQLNSINPNRYSFYMILKVSSDQPMFLSNGLKSKLIYKSFRLF